MKIPVKKLSSGFWLPVIGLGTFGIGGYELRDPEEDVRRAISSIKDAIDLGITHIDTAEMYAEGYCEILIGKAITGYKRSDLVIATKVSPINLSYHSVIKAAEDSLKRLRTDYIDIFIIHYPNYKLEIEETMKAMDYLIEKGSIKYIGVSNFTRKQFEDVQKYTENKIVLNQIPYSLVNRKFQADGFIDYARLNDVMIVSWSPIERGLLARGGIEILDRISEKYSKTQAQVAINWLISQKNVVTIPASRSINHLKENLGSLNWSPAPEDQRILDYNFPKKIYTGADKFWSEIIENTNE
jgi:diketogulonate reductase-like aldo/keto reductase